MFCELTQSPQKQQHLNATRLHLVTKVRPAYCVGYSSSYMFKISAEQLLQLFCYCSRTSMQTVPGTSRTPRAFSHKRLIFSGSRVLRRTYGLPCWLICLLVNQGLHMRPRLSERLCAPTLPIYCESSLHRLKQSWLRCFRFKKEVEQSQLSRLLAPSSSHAERDIPQRHRLLFLTLTINYY